MKPTPAITCSLIITTYNRPAALDLVLKSAACQSVLPNDIIVADDGSSSETKTIVDHFSSASPNPVIHSWHEDKGFRLAASRNRAIALSRNSYIILVDGDMVLHRHFILDHLASARHSQFIQGSRVLLSQKTTDRILSDRKTDITLFEKGLRNRANAIYSRHLSALFSKQKNTLHGIRGCNMSFFRDDCIAINGFNEDFNGWGREDSEFVARFFNNAGHRLTLKFHAIGCHLWHKEHSRKSLPENDEILDRTIAGRLKRCSNGIDKYRDQ